MHGYGTFDKIRTVWIYNYVILGLANEIHWQRLFFQGRFILIVIHTLFWLDSYFYKTFSQQKTCFKVSVFSIKRLPMIKLLGNYFNNQLIPVNLINCQNDKTLLGVCKLQILLFHFFNSNCERLGMHILLNVFNWLTGSLQTVNQLTVRQHFTPRWSGTK